MLIVEIDGSQHVESTEDVSRTTFLNREGYSVLRFWNTEVLREPNGVHELLHAVVAGDWH